MVIHPFVWRIMHYSCYPLIFTKRLFTYPLSNILYLGYPYGNIISNYHGTFIHIFMYGCYLFLNIYQTSFFCQFYRFIFRCILFFTNVTSKIFHFLQVENFMELVSLKFMSCHLPQVNLLQHFIRFSIRKR